MTVEETAVAIESRLDALELHRNPIVREVRREFTKRLANAEPAFVRNLALRLLRRPEFHYRLMAYELICRHGETMRSLGERDLEMLGKGIDSWEDVDTFACYVAGPVWHRGQVSDGLIRRWTASDDRWWRRAALVCTVALNNRARGGTGDTLRTLEICRLLVDDHDDMVQKAMSWALRELSKRDPESVRDFVSQHRTRLAARVLREVAHKLETGLKNPRRGSSATFGGDSR